MRAFTALLAGREPQRGAEVLHDISLEIQPGESFGVIGENGAGKSTLLKILTGVIKPSRGTVSVNARVAALLELGAGFQPEFSGIDNVRMKASLLGMSAKQLESRMADILEFADIGEYVHEPVKHYSSGMVVRLGFAVVASSDPEILITDEVLAVGDESFQKKCINWIESYLQRGNTLLMVSHSMYLVQKLCQKALWLHEGRARKQGDVFEVTQSYLAWHETRSAQEKRGRESAAGDNGLYRIDRLTLQGAALEDSTQSDSGEDVRLKMGDDIQAEMILHSPDGRPPVALFGIVRADGTPVYGVASEHDGVKPGRLDAHRFRFGIRFRAPALLPGSYSIRGHAMDPEGLRVCDTAELRLQVLGDSRELGFVHLPHEWN
jgi:lipopolysaccharide transport system ATP-binding protein